MEPQSKVDCPIETPVFYPAETLPYEVTDILSGIRTSRRPARCGEPRNQSDCPAGTKFREGMPEKEGGAYMRAIPAICIKSVFAEDYGDDYGYTPEPRLPEPTSQADCPNGTVFAPSYVGCPPGWPSQLGCQPRKQPAQCKELDFGPRSQADCPEGTTFTVFGGGKDDLGMPRVGQAMCLKSKVISKSCEQQYADYLVWLQENGPRIKIKPETKEEFMAKCEGKSAAPTVEPKMMGMSANWLVPAILVGVGIYLITRKSE